MTKRGNERQNMSSSAELMVRYEVMRILADSPNCSVMLPSYRQLAEKFHFSERSIANAIKRLIDEGWAHGRRGVGVFTNPGGRQIWGGQHHRVIGIGAHDSPFFSYDYNNWALMLYPGLAVTPRLGFPRPVNLFCPPGRRYLELRNLNLDALIWTLPGPEIAPDLVRLVNDGMPVVTLLNRIEGVPCVGIDFVHAGRQIGRMLLEEEKTSVLWCLPDKYTEQKRRGVHEVFAAAGVTNAEEVVLCERNDLEARLEQMLRAGKRPDAVYTRASFLHRQEEIFRKHGLDLFNDALIIADWSAVRHLPDFHGIRHRYPFEALANEVAGLLERILNGEPAQAMPPILLHLDIERC